MIARYGAGWRDSWQKGLQRRRRRRHRPPQCHFLMPSTRPRLLRGSFDFGDHGGGAAHETGVGIIERFDAVGMLENL